MSNFTLDHIFCFCEPQVSGEIENAAKAGFTVNAGNRHQGQGTANRSIVFEENYLELIFLESLTDAQVNPLRLDKRAEWRKTGASPFGICLRGAISKDESSQFWSYHPPYWPDGAIFIHKSNEESPGLPLIFVIPSSTRPVERPNVDVMYFSHRSGAKAIQKVDISGPNYQWPLLSMPHEITLSKTEQPHMKVKVDGKLKNEIFLNSLLTIVGASL